MVRHRVALNLFILAFCHLNWRFPEFEIHMMFQIEHELITTFVLGALIVKYLEHTKLRDSTQASSHLRQQQ